MAKLAVSHFVEQIARFDLYERRNSCGCTEMRQIVRDGLKLYPTSEILKELDMQLSDDAGGHGCPAPFAQLTAKNFFKK